jgi:putative transposase
MAKKTFTVEKVISILRLVEVKAAQGSTVVEIYRWRKEYGGVRSEGAKRLKDFEKENDRFKKLVAELLETLDVTGRHPSILALPPLKGLFRDADLPVNIRYLCFNLRLL